MTLMGPVKILLKINNMNYIIEKVAESTRVVHMYMVKCCFNREKLFLYAVKESRETKFTMLGGK